MGAEHSHWEEWLGMDGLLLSQANTERGPIDIWNI